MDAKPTSIAEAWEQRRAELPHLTTAQAVQARRDFYAGALAGAAIPPQQVLRECIDFARAIGTVAELAG